MFNLFFFIALASAQSDYVSKVAFYGENADLVKSDCKAVELKIRERLQAVEKEILRSEKSLINVKAEYVHEVTPASEGSDFVSDYCKLHFVSFTEALGFEVTRSNLQKHLGNKRKARVACDDEALGLLESDEHIVYARSSSRYRLFKGGHQCDVMGIRVVQMLTN